MPSAQKTDQNVSLVFNAVGKNRISVADPDAGSAPLKLTLGVLHGTLTLAATAHLTFLVGSNASKGFTAAGAQTDLNNALAGLTYTPSANFSGSDILILGVDDQGNQGAGGALTAANTIALAVNRVNQPPVVSVPGTQTIAPDTALVFSAAQGNAILVSDIDGGNALETLTLTATRGSLMLAGGNGLSFVTATFTGTLGNLNRALDGLVFVPDTGYQGTAEIDLVLNDQGHSGVGGAKVGKGSILVQVGNGKAQARQA